jgi:phenylpropionate dioxygenase-like ring-hydroxylating dioxygenase large terminal subunit
MMRNRTAADATTTDSSHHSIPSSWYYAACSSEIPAGGVVRKELFGQVLALWRTASGLLHASDATCPHLGSDLGRLGKVVGEHLQCFSHRFEYDGEGNCAKTPRSAPCRSKNVLYSWPVHEVGGFVLLWYDAARRAPTWRIPEEIFATAGKGRFVKSQYVFDCSVQTINEDNFDVGHLYNWHELQRVRSTLPRVDGHTISVTHDFERHSILVKRPLPGPLSLLTRQITSRYGSTLYGHGLTYSFIDLPAFDFSTQDFIWPTPLGAGRTLYTTFLRRNLPSGKRTLRQRVVDSLIHPLLFPMFVLRLRGEHRSEGHGFWENQRRVDDPIITAEERAMLEPYWEWCKQFDPAQAPVRRYRSLGLSA